MVDNSIEGNSQLSTDFKMRSNSIITGGLRWLSPGVEYPVQLLIFKGYQSINFAAAYGSHAATGYGPQNFDFNLYEHLIPAPVADWDPEVSKYRCAPTHYSEFISGWSPGFNDVVNDNVLPKISMSSIEIMQWLLFEMKTMKLHTHRYHGLFKDSTKLIQLGYRLSRVAGRKFPLNSTPFAAALCMIGLGSIYHWRREKVCPNCYRIASPQTDRCHQHSQSKYVYLESRSRSLNSQSARTGRRVVSMLNWNDHPPIGLLTRLCVSEWKIAGMLWPLRGKQHNEWNQLVESALHDAPLIRQLLPQNFLSLSNNKQLSLLRAALDENEWVIDRWPDKIKLAQLWFEKERIIAPGHPPAGFSDLNKERLKQASALRDEGLKPSEIAKKLGISNSHLSQLWRRQKMYDKS